MILITMYGTECEHAKESNSKYWNFKSDVIERRHPSWLMKPIRCEKYGLIWVGHDAAGRFAFKYDEPPILVQELYAAQHFWNKKKRRKK